MMGRSAWMNPCRSCRVRLATVRNSDKTALKARVTPQDPAPDLAYPFSPLADQPESHSEEDVLHGEIPGHTCRGDGRCRCSGCTIGGEKTEVVVPM